MIKRVTFRSILLWLVSSSSIVWYDLARTGIISAPFLPPKNIFLAVNIALLFASSALMRNSKRDIILPTKSNPLKENVLNCVNIIFSLLAAISYLKLSGLFGTNSIAGIGLLLSGLVLGAYLIFEAFFILHMNARERVAVEV